ncbi:MAG: PQQ-binding-like beta-propeller repeat protein [Schlesneria sp.]
MASFSTKIAVAALGFVFAGYVSAADKFNPTEDALNFINKMKVSKYDWPQWGGSPHRNNTPAGENIPFKWNLETGENVLWASPLGSQTYGNPVIANGKVFVGTNNTHGYLKRYPSKIDLGVLLAFEEKTGKFLWQASSPKLPTGRVHDWPQQGVCSTVYCDDKRLWYNTSRGEVVCLDVEGFHDGENDGPFKAEANENLDEADLIWRYDMMGDLGVSQHNMCSCSITCVGDRCFVITGNGVDEGHINLPAPNAPSFICLDKNTGKLLWTDKSPGLNILHGQWSSPCVFEAGGREQVVMGGGDGWLYSFDPAGDGKGGAKLLWKFDGNPKDSLYVLGGRSTRNHLISTPVFYDGYVYVGMGEDPEHGEGNGHLYCIDPTKRGDVSLELAVDGEGKEIPHKRLKAVDSSKGEKAIPNPNTAAIWHYDVVDRNKNGKKEFEETMHRTMGSVAIKDDLLFVTDIGGLVHCVDAKKVVDGKPVVYWTHDMFSAAWGSVLIVDGKVYVGDEDGDITVFELSKELNVLAENNMINSLYTTPVVASDTLFIANKSTLIALKSGAKLKGGVKQGSTEDAGGNE